MGVMITASHNHHADNGVKIIEPDGSMLVQDWERFSEIIVNAGDSQDLAKTLGEISLDSFSNLPSDLEQLFGVTPVEGAHAESIRVLLAMDTRESSPLLINAIKKGLKCFGVSYQDLGL